MKILLVDDHALFRAGLRLLLTTVDPDIAVFEAGTLAEATALSVSHADLRLCLLDLALAEGHGIHGLSQLRVAAPDIVIVVVSANEDVGIIHACLDAGAMSYIPKSAPPAILMEALREVLAGRIYLPAHVGLDLPRDPSARPVLTSRQRDVLRGLCQGLPNKSIANRLGLSEFTVREHIATIFRILGVRNRTEAVIRSHRQHLWSNHQ